MQFIYCSDNFTRDYFEKLVKRTKSFLTLTGCGFDREFRKFPDGNIVEIRSKESIPVLLYFYIKDEKLTEEEKSPIKRDAHGKFAKKEEK